mmetsp:Transcript_11820/g.30341  ORF Transcript_11820/g.30341 Transcript_11820/m.30341 type:complete len:239 (-) Transcript_11820:137-853(-)
MVKHFGGPAARFCLSSSTNCLASPYSALAFLNRSRSIKLAFVSTASCRLPTSENNLKRSPFLTVFSVAAAWRSNSRTASLSAASSASDWALNSFSRAAGGGRQMPASRRGIWSRVGFHCSATSAKPLALVTASEANTRSNVFICNGISSQDSGFSPEKASFTLPFAAATASGGNDSATSTPVSTIFLSSVGSVVSVMSISADVYGGSVSAVCAARTLCDESARLSIERWSRALASRRS